MPQTIYDILAEFRADKLHNRIIGDRFERLICRYLELDPIHAQRFSNVWMWNEWPQKGQVGDIGIDLVAEERATGEFCAIQCKFYLPEHTLSKADLDSFFTASGKSLFTSCIIVSTTDKWGSNAEHALANQSKPVQRISVHDLAESPVDWSHFSLSRLNELPLRKKKELKEHQKLALKNVVAGFASSDRGKLIMACGTGKTFTSLKIAEHYAAAGHVLFLVPSLSLLSQSLREWTAECDIPIRALAVCSDSNIGKKVTKTTGDASDNADITTSDLAFPATTSAKELLRQYDGLQRRHTKNHGVNAAQPMTVIFSTYQSLQAVAEAQKLGFPDFQLIICDEAHRTTGVTLSGEDESHFIRIHDASSIRGSLRLYMTATPRIYSDDTKVKAGEADAELCSMDDHAIFGPEFHRLGFGEAVAADLLSDYQVLVLAVDEKYVSKTFQGLLKDADSEINLDDAAKITGCWNGLAKRLDSTTTATTNDFRGDLAPMRRAVAFSRSIKDSKAFKDKFSQLIAAYRETHPDEDGLLDCELEHVDGTFAALRRNSLLDWLKADAPADTCRILTNARCLSEGVDVPELDAVLFLNPRNSVVDVVQSVGRVMRKTQNDRKKYGYIILPIGIPADMAPEEALKDNQKYKVVWQVLQALRSHDERFNAVINQIELNEKRPNVINIIGVGGGRDKGNSEPKAGSTIKQVPLAFPQLEEWKTAIYARIVLKCGDRAYWEKWAKDVAVIAEHHMERIRSLIEDGQPRHRAAFAEFLEGLRQNLNPSISAADAIEMLSQHLITRPVFDALFENYAFTQQNPVSKAMQTMLDLLEDQGLEKETASLDKFYESVRKRAAGIDNAAGRQKVVIELYDKFFRTAFPKMAERLGIVYTPVEVVDFIVHSVQDMLEHEFHSGMGDKDVHIIDPFTGTGTFIVRLLQSGLIPATDLQRKYEKELHANEIILLAYYIAAINIEETYHSLQRKTYRGDTSLSYTPFDGIVLTDTFQIFESKHDLEEKMFPENNQRVKRQKNSPIRVVIANPPYSSKQESENDGNKNIKYPQLDERIRSTYAEQSSATNKNGLYDSYIRALRWASDRLGDKGIVGFVSNGSFIESNSMEGIRASLASEFSTIYVFNLRGNARTSGEQRRMEKGNVFGEGTRTPVAISLCIKNPEKKGPCEIYYHDIGDYLTREEKLKIISKFASVNGIHREKGWQQLKPNAAHDWINQRDPAFETFVSLGDKKEAATKVVFETYSRGLETARDTWVYNFSDVALTNNISHMIDFYNEQVDAFVNFVASRDSTVTNSEELSKLAEGYINTDAKKISWSRALKRDLCSNRKYVFNADAKQIAIYRPFCKTHVYLNRSVNNVVGALPNYFPKNGLGNVFIYLSGIGNSGKECTALIVDCVPDLNLQHSGGQGFPLYVYEKIQEEADDLISRVHEGDEMNGYRRRSALTDAILSDFRGAYETRITKEDIFYYVYGILHSPEYKARFASDLKKMLPRIPFTQDTADFWRFSQAGRDLAHWHLNYESVELYPLAEHRNELGLDPAKLYRVQKMTHGRVHKAIDRSVIVYNSHLALSGIPLEAYDYIVNGKSALDWVMERYQVTIDKDSGLRNDPNDWMTEHNDPAYLVNLLKRITRVSLETMKIVANLPALNERKPGQTKNVPVVVKPWRDEPLQLPSFNRPLLKDDYRPTIILELLAQTGLPVTFEEFRRAYCLLSQPDVLAEWAEKALSGFDVKKWRREFKESLPVGGDTRYLFAMVERGNLKLRVMEGQPCIVETKGKAVGIEHLVCDARLAILAVEAESLSGAVPPLSSPDEKELLEYCDA